MKIFARDDFSELEMRYVLPSVLFFIIQRNEGIPEREAIQKFYRTKLCQSHGKNLTFGDIDHFASFAYCD
jgi:hypothetical protein